MQVKIFYSWQSDTDKKYNLSFIQKAIEKAIKSLQSEYDIYVEWNLDRDTSGVLGAIDIVETIFKKITECHIFIGDITIINSTFEGKKTPNPNVLLELGYAAREIGWKNIITVFNENYGAVEELPFDLRHKRPVKFQYAEMNSEQDRITLEKDFIKVLKKNIEKANPHYTNQKRRFEIEFAEESKESRRLVLDKPNLWMERLIQELLRDKLKEIDFLDYEVNEELCFENVQIMEMKEFLDWSGALFQGSINMIKVFEKTLRQELNKALEEDDDFEFAIQLKRSIERACNICKRALEFERHLLSIQPPEPGIRLKGLLLGYSKIFVVPFRSYFEQICNIIDEVGKKKASEKKMISLEIKGHVNAEEIFKELRRLRESY